MGGIRTEESHAKANLELLKGNKRVQKDTMKLNNKGVKRKAEEEGESHSGLEVWE